MSTALLVVLLSLFRGPLDECMRCRAADIAARADRAESAYGVPAGLLLAVGYLESRLGCDPRSGGCWGAPVDRRHRGTAGTSDHAARALARSRAVCGSWRGAVARFRCGLCRCVALRGYKPDAALRLAERMYRGAGAEAPWSGEEERR